VSVGSSGADTGKQGEAAHAERQAGGGEQLLRGAGGVGRVFTHFTPPISFRLLVICATNPTEYSQDALSARSAQDRGNVRQALNSQRTQFAGHAKWSPYISVKYRSLAGDAV